MNRHQMAEVIVRCLKLLLATWVVKIRSHVEHITELRIAVSVGLDRAALTGTDHSPRFLDMNVQGVIGPEQFPQECVHVNGQLLFQPLECTQTMQLIQTRFAHPLNRQ